jgi:hypothetical protein
MIEYSSIGGQACHLLLNIESKGSPIYPNWQERFAFFQYRLDQWEQHIATDFQLAHESEGNGQARQLLRTIFHLRANHLRILVSRAFLWANLPTVSPPNIWAISVQNAANTIQILADLDTSTKIYRFQQTQFICFLASALGMLLLTITQNSSSRHVSPSSNNQSIPVPLATVFKAGESVTAAVNLLQSQAEFSIHSRCLWERVRGLACRLNLFGGWIPGLPEVASGTSNEVLFADILQSEPSAEYQTREMNSDWYDTTRNANFNGVFLPSSPMNFTPGLELLLDNSFFGNDV